MEKERKCPVCSHDYITVWEVEGKLKGECDKCEHTDSVEKFDVSTK